MIYVQDVFRDMEIPIYDKVDELMQALRDISTVTRNAMESLQKEIRDKGMNIVRHTQVEKPKEEYITIISNLIHQIVHPRGQTNIMTR